MSHYQFATGSSIVRRREPPIGRLLEIKSIISRFEMKNEEVAPRRPPPPERRRSYQDYSTTATVNHHLPSVIESRIDEEDGNADNWSTVAYKSDAKRGFAKTVGGFLWIGLRCCLGALNMHLAIATAALSALAPKIFAHCLIYPCCRLLFGTLYPAYASYKAVRTKNVKEYVKWMMYWIVFALFTCIETFTDVFLSWFPFYYEIKILFVLWLLLPATKGSSILYRKFVHPALCRREQEIDECITKAKEQGYHTVLSLGSKGVNYATNVIMQTAIRGGGGLVQQLRKSYSLSDLTASEADHLDGGRSSQESDRPMICDSSENRVVRRSVSTKARSPRPASSPRVDMYFSEVDVSVARATTNGRDSVNISHIRSSEDISSSYIPENSTAQDSLMRTSSISGARTRSKVNRNTFTSIKRPGAAEDDEVIIEEIDDSDDSPYYMDNTEDGSFDQYLKFLLMQNPNAILNESDYEKYNVKFNEFKTFLNLMNTNRVLSEEKGGVFSNDTKNDSTVDKSDKQLEKECLQRESSKSGFQINEIIKNEGGNTKNTTMESSNESPVPIDSTKIIIESELSVNIEPEEESKTLEPEIDNKDVSSIGSVSNVSSDSEEAETQFTTPEGSPVLKAKLAKNRKRQAPPPPPSEKNMTEIEVTEKPTSTTVDPTSVEAIPKSVETLSVESASIETTSIEPTDKKSKSKPKKEAGISKLLHLPTKFAFWNKTDGSNESASPTHSNKSSEFGSTVDIEKKLNDISSDINRSLASLRSMSDQFEDAMEPTSSNSKALSSSNEEVPFTYASKSTEV